MKRPNQKMPNQKTDFQKTNDGDTKGKGDFLHEDAIAYHTQLDRPVTTMRTLDRQRLDVVNKTRSNIFGWRGQFTPEFVEYVLNEANDGTGLVIDPFCGSGTVLQECAARNRAAHGFEINPAAYAMSRFFTLSKLSHDERIALASRVEQLFRSASSDFVDLPLFNPVENYRGRASNLLDLGREVFSKTESKAETLLALLTLFETEGCRLPNLNQAVFTALGRMKRHLLALAHSTSTIEASLCDARLVHRYVRGEAELIVTSPPYINVFNYHQNHRAILELLGFDLLHVAASEIGSNRKNRGNRFRTVIQYALDMEACAESFALSLKPRGQLVLVVGRESNVRGISVPNSRLVADIVTSLGGFNQEGSFERCFINRFGVSIYEDVLLFRRVNGQPAPAAARGIARLLLENLEHEARGEIQDDVRDAIISSEAIEPSPIFSRNPQL
jgi:methylase of polypeptide subunit release factors